jgi:mannose-6-phosphate isomerase-like protein (cupin superfamily)
MGENIDLSSIKESIVKNVYHVSPETKIPLHKHAQQDEIFYCMKGSGFGVLQEKEIELTVGSAFIVTAGTMHSLRSDGDLYVSSFLVPVVDDRKDRRQNQ